MFTSKEIKVIDFLTSNNNKFINEIASELNVSDRSIRNYVENINLKSDNLISIKMNIVTINYQVDTSNVYIEMKFISDVIYMLFITDKINIKKLEEKFHISNKTIYSQIGKIKKRESCLYASEIYKILDDNMIEVLCEYFKINNLNRFEMILYILNHVNDLKKYSTQSLCEDEFKKFLSKYPEYDEIFLEKVFPIYLFEKNINMVVDKNKSKEIFNEIINRCNIVFLNQVNKDNEIMYFMKLHIDNSLYRYQENLLYDTSGVEKILYKQQEMYDAIKNVIKIIFKENDLFLNETECIYLAIYIINNVKVNMEKTKKIIIACPHGISSSLIMQNQIKQFYENIEILDIHDLKIALLMKEEVDFIITNKETKENDVKIIKVNEVFTINDFKTLNLAFKINEKKSLETKEIFDLLKPYFKDNVDYTEIQHRLFYKKNKKTGVLMLKELLTEEMVHISPGVNNWEEAIKKAALPLLGSKIKENYIDQMIQSVLVNGPYIVIADQFAIPHANSPEDVLSVGMSFLKLETPILFPNDKEVSILLVIATNDSTSHLNALQELTTKIINDDFVQNVLKTKSKEEIMNLIRR